MTTIEETLGFLGAGNMAEALVRGLLAAGTTRPESIWVTDTRSERCAELAAELGVQVADGAEELLEKAEAIILAVKPQNLSDVMAGLAGKARPHHLFISILAGTRTEKIEAGLAHPECPAVRVVRVMPNTPALLRAGASALAPGVHATAEDMRLARTLFEAVGTAEIVKPDQMDAITGLTGSGPAYVFRLIETLIEAGVEQGLERGACERLVKQMVLGSARMAAESEHDPAELRRRVTSPGGTTAAGLAVLEEQGFARLIADTVDAATRRSAELGR